jgi:uncharacterized membrane protein
MIKSPRIESIDLLRGFVMVVMALDHVRDYFHADAFLYDPVDLSKTSVIVFFTRWITHYCAPVFVFLAGTSAFMVGQRKGKSELAGFLLKRGLWLIFLELTVINFGWFFNIHFTLPALIVIWALGIGMIVLAACNYLPWKVILALGIVLVVGHNLLDPIHVAGQGIDAVLWSMLHEQNGFALGEGRILFVGYPILPWVGVMLLGYCFGILYQAPYDAEKRRKILVSLGSGMIVLFIVIRFINMYGDPAPWSSQQAPVFTFLSFLNVTKYPPSLLYVLMTLGPAILFLAFAEGIRGWLARAIIVLGRVPLFYYVLHIYLIHLFAMLAAVLLGYAPSTMVFNMWINNSPELKGFGFSLGVVYLVWISLVALLYPLCKWFEKYKADHKNQWWLSYL